MYRPKAVEDAQHSAHHYRHNRRNDIVYALRAQCRQEEWDKEELLMRTFDQEEERTALRYEITLALEGYEL